MATIEKRSDSHGSLTYRVKVRMRGYPQATASFKRRTEAKRVNAARTLLHMDAKHADTTEQDATY